MTKPKNYSVHYEETIEDLSHTFITKYSLSTINENWDYFEDKIINEIQSGTDGRLRILSIEKLRDE